MDSGTTTLVTPHPSSVWGIGSNNNKLDVSLSDIMSEQLANDLQTREDLDYVNSLQITTEPADAVDNPFELTEGTTNELSEETYKDDHLIAQMLQMQFDQEYDHMLTRTEEKCNGTSKLALSYSNYRVLPENLVYETDSEEEYDDRKRNWDSFEASAKAFPTIGRCGYSRQGEKIVTKHDIPMSQSRNACRIMEFSPVLETGDGGGFDMQLPNKVFNALRKHSKSQYTRRARLHDKAEISTAEMAVDMKTRLLLYKMLNSGVLDEIHGVISKGKEAVLFHADGGMCEGKVVPKECAIKIFMTTLNEFKTRDKYIRDDYRFKDRFTKQNPRKMIHMWAEKEMHNLISIQKAGIKCPEVVLLKKHILVMSFIGTNGTPAPKIKDAVLSAREMEQAYKEVYENMKVMFNECRLVHADLSEYNILWHDGHCYFIDVSQSVEHTHPSGLEFLIRDCTNISNFFGRYGVSDVKSPEEMFEDITGHKPTGEDADVIAQIQNFERNEELLTHDLPEQHYSFDHCFEHTKHKKAPKSPKSPKSPHNASHRRNKKSSESNHSKHKVIEKPLNV